MHYGLEGDIVRCPWHGWEFRVSSGDAAFDMSRLKLRTITVEVGDDDVVYVVV
jgi:nitrite reductase (NADH) small subunit